MFLKTPKETTRGHFSWKKCRPFFLLFRVKNKGLYLATKNLNSNLFWYTSEFISNLVLYRKRPMVGPFTAAILQYILMHDPYTPKNLNLVARPTTLVCGILKGENPRYIFFSSQFEPVIVKIFQRESWKGSLIQRIFIFYRTFSKKTYTTVALHVKPWTSSSSTHLNHIATILVHNRETFVTHTVQYTFTFLRNATPA